MYSAYLVRFGGAGACLPFLFVERLICTRLLFPLFERPPINVLNLVTELVDSKIMIYYNVIYVVLIFFF